ncbi:hypothetical protein BC832DRAFT_556143 [Gaertneriomyces semiglobifer]|nr:hypothetical protein BC832DRAFT_556143 [Gaertneriomyces semiglobifer]
MPEHIRISPGPIVDDIYCSDLLLRNALLVTVAFWFSVWPTQTNRLLIPFQTSQRSNRASDS